MHDDCFTDATLDPLFKTDIDTLKKKALAESFNTIPEFCESKKEYVKPKLDQILSELQQNNSLLDLEWIIKESHEEPDDSRLIACSVHDPLSGQLTDFDYTEMACIN